MKPCFAHFSVICFVCFSYFILKPAAFQIFVKAFISFCFLFHHFFTFSSSFFNLSISL
ncbi:membrane protein [gut metagenome]|uniref:Membrane protein n=1 Tax=gut metagenome TaxID=749906 RepID=J9FJ62_9ZZZZ